MSEEMQSILNKKTFVTMPSIAPLSEFTELLESVWDSGILTHNGPLVRRLESEINAYLGSRNMVVMTNGTVAIQLAMKALNLRGEVITTPFSWVATCSSILWEHCQPVFVDIDPKTLNMDAEKLEAAINHRTSAIMPVHVFSNPCDIDAIDSLASKHDLSVIYDAAHAMAVKHKGRDVLEYGTISATSFHATKLFNTGEGGGCVTMDDDLFEKLKRIRFFGHDNNKDIIEDGCNGKMTEIHAALGIANLRYLDGVRAKRREIYQLYKELLEDCAEIEWQSFNEAEYNYSYMPIILPTEEKLLVVLEALAKKDIHGRRYFYPSLNIIKAVGPYQPCPVSESIAKRIMCLPSFNELSLEKVAEISKIVKDAL